MEYYYKQPKYYSSFHCIGGECPVSCCDGWNVDWYDAEVEKLKKANMSDELRNKVEKSFVFMEERKSWLVKMSRDNRCPFHNRETGLCLIQKELGAEYLGDICTNYPRIFYLIDNYIFRSISSSCPAVFDLIVNNKNAVTLENIPVRNAKQILKKTRVRIDTKEHRECVPYLRFRLMITEFILEILHGNRSLDISIILAAMAAKKISDVAESNANEIPKIINTYRTQLTQASTSRAVDSIEPNLRLKFIIVNNLMVKYLEDLEADVNISVLHDGENVILANYERGKEEFDKVFAGREWAMRNIAENMFLDVFYHLNLTKGTFFEMFAYFTACVAAVQVFARAIGFVSKNIESDFIMAISHLNRKMSHSKETADKLVLELKDLGLTTPAHLALIIK